jgi:DNA-binding transcriptional ArsR family regulator
MATSLAVLDAGDQAATLLHPLRSRILDQLGEPASATEIARRLGLPRQKVNYHLRELETAGFVEEVETRRKGNCTERLVRATASYYVIAPHVLREVDSAQTRDRFSSTYLIALLSDALRQVVGFRERARRERKKLATFSLQVDVRFRSASERAEFTEKLASAVASLAADYHDGEAPGGRSFRFLLGAYPSPPTATGEKEK